MVFVSAFGSVAGELAVSVTGVAVAGCALATGCAVAAAATTVACAGAVVLLLTAWVAVAVTGAGVRGALASACAWAWPVLNRSWIKASLGCTDWAWLPSSCKALL